MQQTDGPYSSYILMASFILIYPRPIGTFGNHRFLRVMQLCSEYKQQLSPSGLGAEDQKERPAPG
jgi:hypothetical protein